MSTITIRHTGPDGTMVEGSRPGDGVWDTLKGLYDGWTYRRRIGMFLAASRDKPPQTWKIDRAADALRAAGHDVTVTIEDDPRTIAEIEAGKIERAEDRAAALDARADRVGQQADADYARARQMADAIPFGQPMMPDHHSYRRDVNYRRRMGATYDRAFAGMDERDELRRKAAAAAATVDSRDSVPGIRRKIDRLERDQRTVTRNLAGRMDWVDGKWKLVPPGERYRAQLQARAGRLAAEIAYWQAQLDALADAGAKVWTAADFTRGDFTLTRDTWAEVIRVNPKSLTIAYGVNTVNRPVVRKADAGGSTWKLPYDQVTARRSAAEQAAAETDNERETALWAAAPARRTRAP